VYHIAAKVAGGPASFDYLGFPSVFTRLRSLGGAVGGFTFTGQSAAISPIGDKRLTGRVGQFLLNDAPPVLVLSHFDTEFDDETGNTVGYNWYATSAPAIDTTIKKFGAGALTLGLSDDDYLYTYLNPGIFAEYIPEFTAEASCYIPSINDTVVPFGFGSEANAGGLGYYLEVEASRIRFNAYGPIYGREILFEYNIASQDLLGWHHIAFEQTQDGFGRIYLDGQPLDTDLDDNGSLFILGPQYNTVGEPIDIRSAIFVGNWATSAGGYRYLFTDGNIDEFRLIGGLVYAGNSFVPSDAPYTVESPLALLAGLTKLRNFECAVGTYTLTGNDITIGLPSSSIVASSGAFVLQGQPIGFVRGTRVMSLQAAAYTSTFNPTQEIPSVLGAVSTSVSTGAINLAWPAGYAVGDMGLVFIESSGSGTVGSRPPTPPYGWIPVQGWPLDDVGSYTNVYYRLATSTDEPNLITPTSNNHQVAVLIVIRNVDRTQPFVEVQTNVDLVADNAVVFPDLNAVVPQTRLLELISHASDTVASLTLSSRANVKDAWVDEGLVHNRSTSSGNGGGVAIYAAQTIKQLSTLPGSTAIASISSSNTLGVIALRPQGWEYAPPPLSAVIDVSAGAFTLEGQSSDLVYTVPLRTLPAAGGDYTFTGYDSLLTRLLLIPSAVGSYDLTGQVVGASRLYTLLLNGQAFTLDGQSAGLVPTVPLRTLPADDATYFLTGHATSLTKGLIATAESGAYGVDGQIAALAITRRVTGLNGAFVLEGQDVIPPASGPLEINGGDSTSNLANEFNGGSAASALTDDLEGGNSTN
jgi:hypothetical protein